MGEISRANALDILETVHSLVRFLLQSLPLHRRLPRLFLSFPEDLPLYLKDADTVSEAAAAEGCAMLTPLPPRCQMSHLQEIERTGGARLSSHLS
ncbi:hypothetical protein AXF42_Ash018283 [Apostasia shenzhenica]|uniref:Uncharacterized protein n=1 Tax=Apostasia shenzhenica TaxID=1088818 RepID=A0A2I0B2P1_9ASPA|nr:hypothetical protein AXF42_Ash018283 [Apostasia shenzhenica]